MKTNERPREKVSIFHFGPIIQIFFTTLHLLSPHFALFLRVHGTLSQRTVEGFGEPVAIGQWPEDPELVRGVLVINDVVGHH